MQKKQINRHRRHKRVRAKTRGTGKIPRLCVFRSNKHIYGQLVDDDKGKTLIAASDLEIKSSSKKQKTANKTVVAHEVGELLAKKAIEKKFEKMVFDRGGYKYHGRIKALAEGAREGGLKF